MLAKQFPATVNGDNIIFYTNSRKFRSQFGETDLSTLYGYYDDDPDKNHLGMVNLFSNITNSPVPMYMTMLKNDAVIYVNGANGKFTYDLPISKSFKVQTIMDTSNEFLYPGRDGALFRIALNGQFVANDILTYNLANGCQIAIAGEYPPEPFGEGFIYYVRLLGSRVAYFPKEFLRPGVQYTKISDGLGEFSTQFSTVQGVDSAASMRCEFELGNHRGVEASLTMYAGMKKRYSGAALSTQTFFNDIERRIWDMKKMNNNEDINLAIIGRNIGTPQKPKLGPNAMVATLMETLIFGELFKMEANQLLFQRAATFRDQNSIVRLNEGIYHQLRRGPRITYSRPGGITKDVLMAAADYVFRGRPDIEIQNRRIRFKAGRKAYENIMTLFRSEAFAQLSWLSGAGLMGSDRVLPSNPVSGPLTDLKLGPVMFTTVFIPAIGLVEVVHEPSLDYTAFADRRTLIDGNIPESSYSLIIEDITDSAWTNAYAAIPNTAEARIGNLNNNVFYVKPEGSSLWWGTRNGRWSSRNAGDIVSSYAEMREDIFCHSISAPWIRDNSKMLLIELQGMLAQ